MITPPHAVMGALGACLAGALLTILVPRDRRLAGWLALGASGAASLLALWAAVTTLTGASAQPAAILELSGLGFALRLQVDGLTAVFLILIAIVSLPSVFFSIPYLEHYPAESPRAYYPWLLVFLAAMYGLVSTTDMMWFFFIFWQMMTIPGYALIRFERGNPCHRRAANRYLLMMQIACALTMLGAALLAGTGSAGTKYDFESVSRAVPALLSAHPGTAALAFGLFLAGFGIKMGMWPFGWLWLPDAHPAAPSPVSALLSGVMIKTGVYGVLRYFLWLVPASSQADYPMAAWGWAISVLGTVTLFTGTIAALRQEQTKRLLAYSSIGQVGYILLSLGTCLALLGSANPALASLAALAFFGALFHTLNHGLFKSLLFLNAGAVDYSVGTQDLNLLGGLAKWMPVTAATAFVGSLSVSGVPLFNGFASKWAICVSAVLAGRSAPWLPICAAIAVLTSALTLAVFLKFFGTAFLARTSAWVAGRANGRRSLEVPLMMRLPQVFLALICILLGVLPAIAFKALETALARSPGGLSGALAAVSPFRGPSTLAVGVVDGRALLAPVALALVVGALFWLARVISGLGGAKRTAAAPWLCGYALESEPLRYNAHQFYGEVKRSFPGYTPIARPSASQPPERLQ